MFLSGFIIGAATMALFGYYTWVIYGQKRLIAQIDSEVEKARPGILRRVTAEVNYELLDGRPFQILPGDRVEVDLDRIIESDPESAEHLEKLNHTVQVVDRVNVLIKVNAANFGLTGQNVVLVVGQIDCRRTNRAMQGSSTP